MRINVFVSMVALAVGAVAIAVSAEGAQEDRSASFRQIELFGDVLSRIEADYVSDTDQAELIEAAIEGMLTSLDPHSAYHSPDAYEDLRVTTRGEYGGLGMEVVRRDQYITIVSPIADTPAERAGLRVEVLAGGDTLFVDASEGRDAPSDHARVLHRRPEVSCLADLGASVDAPDRLIPLSLAILKAV